MQATLVPVRPGEFTNEAGFDPRRAGRAVFHVKAICEFGQQSFSRFVDELVEQIRCLACMSTLKL